MHALSLITLFLSHSENDKRLEDGINQLSYRTPILSGILTMLTRPQPAAPLGPR